MNKVNHYDFEIYHPNGGEMISSEDGGYVAYEDYELLQQKLDTMAAENAALKKFCKNASFDADYEAQLGMERGGFEDAFRDIKTPATDTWLNEVRAQGVEMFVKGYAFNLRTSGGGDGYHPEPYHDMADHIEAKCERYTAQLRAGEV